MTAVHGASTRTNLGKYESTLLVSRCVRVVPVQAVPTFLRSVRLSGLSA